MPISPDGPSTNTYLLGVPLFEPDPGALATRLQGVQDRLALLPKTVHMPRQVVNDHF